MSDYDDDIRHIVEDMEELEAAEDFWDKYILECELEDINERIESDPSEEKI